MRVFKPLAYGLTLLLGGALEVDALIPKSRAVPAGAVVDQFLIGILVLVAGWVRRHKICVRT